MSSVSKLIPNINLYNGYLMPQLGLGTWKSKPGEVTEAVKSAIDCGYRHIDCALIYGNENEVGEALSQKIKDGTVKREDLFITSKLWNTFHSKNEARKTIKQSLKNLGLDYLDMYLIHWPMGYKEEDVLFPRDSEQKVIPSDVDYIESWKAMEDMVKEGQTKSIGISNFNHEQIQRILDIAEIKPANLQVECHPYLNQNKLIKFCQENNIAFTAYSPLGSPDRPWAKSEDPSVMSNPIVKKIAEGHNVSTAQIVIRYQLQRNVIVIPKSVTEARIKSNFDVMKFELTAEEMAALDGLNKKFRYCLLEWNADHIHYPFSIEY